MSSRKRSRTKRVARRTCWRDGFECPGCMGSRAALLKSRAYTYECRDCGRQTSITSGTVMHRSKLPLTMWFLAAHFAVTHPLGISTRRLQERLGITYQTAWLLKEKLKLSKSDGDDDLLDGLVEVNHAGNFIQASQQRSATNYYSGRLRSVGELDRTMESIA
jgi:hypothetical protein